MVGELLVNGFYLLGFGGKMGGGWMEEDFVSLVGLSFFYCYICGVE